MKIVFLLIFLYIFLYLIIYHVVEEKIISSIKPYSTYFGIPRVIYRTHKVLHVSKSMNYYCHKEWIRYNPKHSVIWYDTQDCENFMKKMHQRVYKAYKSILPGAYKADLWRACILYKYGGVYVDSYTQPYCSIYKMLYGCINKESQHQFISILDNYGIHNGMIICTPRHPFMKKYIIDIVKNIEKRYYGNRDLEITGPTCLWKSVNSVLSLNNKKFKYGWNYYGELSFYLYNFEPGLSQFVYNKNMLIMRKKYSLIELVNQKIFNYKTTYFSMWREKKIYKD